MAFQMIYCTSLANLRYKLKPCVASLQMYRYLSNRNYSHMILKRVESITGEVEIATFIDGSWKLLATSSGLLQILNEETAFDNDALADFNPEGYKDQIPIRPTAYRDFMLFEQHYIDASRGFVRKYLPKLLPLATTYEAIFRKPFPKFKPSARYYKHPIYYLGNHLNFVSEGGSISIPSYTASLDYELEIAAVINQPLKNASVEAVKKAIAGFVILNDFSARDIQMSEMKSGFGPMKSKNFGSAISACIASGKSLIDRFGQLDVAVKINGQTIAKGHTGGMQFSICEAIAYASWEEQLHAGELFGTGTIPGCSGIENGRMLNPGDSITLEVEGIGTLTNHVI